MAGCLYNAKIDPIPGANFSSLKKYLQQNKMENCLDCEYKYPCPKNTPQNQENKEILLDKLNLERKIIDEKLIQAHIKSGYYHPATP